MVWSRRDHTIGYIRWYGQMGLFANLEILEIWVTILEFRAGFLGMWLSILEICVVLLEILVGRVTIRVDLFLQYRLAFFWKYEWLVLDIRVGFWKPGWKFWKPWVVC